MAVFKCKICGGTLEIVQNSSTAECEYCGSLQSLPRVDDERLAGFYERANDLRMSHEFDKAAEIYEKIIEENPSDADAYWSMVLCRYGIEYVEETKGGIRKPTINRAQLVSVFEDVNYRSAIKYADEAQKRVYEEEAARIDRILQRYLEISRNEPAYDVFICYKETDAQGSRTKDSVRAGEIYRELTAEGFKVFFAPVTLENKLGEDYEPYIFAAIHSAKVMIVIGTKPEYMNAVWVKNEWSRFLTLAKENSKKTLIPVYDEMDPYDMPEAFRFKQSQNMGKLGFMLDLVRGIEKLVGKNNAEKAPQPAQRTAAPAPAANVDTLLQRAQIFLEDQDWNNANIYCEKVLDVTPTNGAAYLYKLLAEAKVSKESSLQYCTTALETMRAYKNAVRYADEATTAKIIGYNREIKERLAREEEIRQEELRVRKEKARIAEEFRQKKQSLTVAVKNASNLVASQVQEKERLEEQLKVSQDNAANLQKYKRKIWIPALLTLVTAFIIFMLFTTEANSGVVFLFWIPQFVFAMKLAGARGKSKGKAFAATFFTVGLLPFFSGLKGLIEAARISVKNLQAEQTSLAADIRKCEENIDISRKSLSELNSKLQDLEKQQEGE